MKKYDPRQIESKWQRLWEETGLYRTPGLSEVQTGEKYYCLVMFPYPSGDLHTGHWYNFAPADAVARFQRMLGKQVLHPIGFDAFGLPAENAAIKRRIPPAEWTAANVTSMSAQLRRIGAMYDWERLVNTSQPDYYRWTQWLFLKLYEAGLAYRAKGVVNWCPKDQTVLANEQTISESGEKNVCVRCGTPIVKKELEQWYFKITDYADRLLEDLDKVEWPDKVKTMQENWIGRSEGAQIEFGLTGLQDGRSKAGSEPRSANPDQRITVFTTRPDTLFGATFLVVSPEVVKRWQDDGWHAPANVAKYVDDALRESELQRQEDAKEKTGADTGLRAIHPLTNKELPVWVADYVLGSYGTGAIMAVPAHDERDHQFARKFNLPVIRVVEGGELPYSGEGSLINSGGFDGLTGVEAKRAIVAKLFEAGRGRGKTQYRLRDWLISRQRYWGTPIPMIYCDRDGLVPVPEEQLPVALPLDVEFAPSGQSPLASRPDFYETDCPKCGGPARRETDTMDTFVDSSWYYLRYPNTKFEDGPFDPAAVKEWLPVDQYIGGIEHAILHLLYSRFITKVLYDQKLVGFEEPFAKLYNQGLILGPDGQKMSKSRGNVVNPDEWVDRYGADTLRLYLMFMGPYDQGGPFSTGGIGGVNRFLYRVWELVHKLAANNPADGAADGILAAEVDRALHKTLKKVTDDLGELRFNTMVAALMELLNTLTRAETLQRLQEPQGAAVARRAARLLVLMLAPGAPHIAEELWHELGASESVHVQPWPRYDPALIKDELVTVVVQVGGKVRGEMVLPAESSEEEMVAAARADANVARHLEDKEVVKTITVPRRLVNFVVK